MAKLRVEFRTYDGVLLRGDYFPAATENSPMVILTQGLSLLKECYIDDTAKRFQSAGIATLVYDHRGWGSSEGTPWQETNPLQQAEDYHDAVTYACSLEPAVDPERVAIWGIGHSGGASMIAFADDPRIKTAVFNMPFTSGRLDAATFPLGALDEARRDRQNHVLLPNHSRTYIPVWDGSPVQAAAAGVAARFPAAAGERQGRSPWLHGEGMYKFISGGIARSTAAGTPWENKLTLQSLYHIARVEPEDWLAKLATQTHRRSFLYLAAKSDVLTGPTKNHRRVFERSGSGLGGPGKFIVTGKDHPDNYFDNWAESVKIQLDFLRENL